MLEAQTVREQAEREGFKEVTITECGDYFLLESAVVSDHAAKLNIPDFRVERRGNTLSLLSGRGAETAAVDTKADYEHCSPEVGLINIQHRLEALARHVSKGVTI